MKLHIFAYFYDFTNINKCISSFTNDLNLRIDKRQIGDPNHFKPKFDKVKKKKEKEHCIIMKRSYRE